MTNQTVWSSAIGPKRRGEAEEQSGVKKIPPEPLRKGGRETVNETPLSGRSTDQVRRLRAVGDVLLGKEKIGNKTGTEPEAGKQ